MRKPSKSGDLHWQSTLIHEATHVIQDKLNRTLRRWDAEAAAHIAQAVMLLSNDDRGAKLSDYLNHEAIGHAARKVCTGDGAKLTRKDFRGVHQAIKCRYPSNDPIPFDGEWDAAVERLLFWVATRAG